MTAVIIITLAAICAVLLWLNTSHSDDGTWTDENGDRWHPSAGRKP